MARRIGRRELIGAFGALGLTPASMHAQSGENSVSNSFNLQFFRTNGMRVRAAVEGDNPLVVMVHGFPGLSASACGMKRPLVYHHH